MSYQLDRDYLNINCEFWNRMHFYTQYVYFELFQSSINKFGADYQPLLPFEIWLITHGWHIIELTKLNKEEPCRIYEQNDFIVTVLVAEQKRDGFHYVQLEDQPELYDLPETVEEISELMDQYGVNAI